MTPTLALQQQALVEALFEWPAHGAVEKMTSLAIGVGPHPARGFRVYQANGHMLAERALASAYPVVQQILGLESFADLARALWHSHPPLRGDIAQWGASLADFLCASEQLQDAPYLADMARVEWLLHCCASAEDRAPDLDTLVLLTTRDPATLGLQLAAGLAVVRSPWPIASMWLAHVEGSPTLAEVGAQLQNAVAQDLVIWRCGLEPRLRLAMPGESALLTALQAGMALGSAVEQAADLDFTQWLPLVVQTGLVLGAVSITT